MQLLRGCIFFERCIKKIKSAFCPRRRIYSLRTAKFLDDFYLVKSSEYCQNSIVEFPAILLGVFRKYSKET